MKRLISLIAALAMVSSLFVTTAFADPKVAPATAELKVEVAVADAEEIADYEEEMERSVTAGYTLYTLTISQTGLGDWVNSNTSTKESQSTKPTGWLPMAIQIDFDFGSDVSKIYEDPTYGIYVDSKFNFGVNVVGNIVQMLWGPWNNTLTYPLSGFKGLRTINAGDPFAVLYLEVNGSATATYGSNTELTMSDLNAGNQQLLADEEVMAAYSGESLTFYENTVVLGSSGGGGSTPEITEADTGFELENKYVENKADLTDLRGEAVKLSKNYGIAKFSETIDTTAKDYFLHVVDDKEKDADLPINFAEQGIEVENASLSFFAIVRSADHNVVSMTLKAVAKSE